MSQLCRNKKRPLTKCKYRPLSLSPVAPTSTTTTKIATPSRLLWTLATKAIKLMIADSETACSSGTKATTDATAVATPASPTRDGGCPERQSCDGDTRASACRLPPWRILVTLTACVTIEATTGLEATNSSTMPYLTSYLRYVLGNTSIDYSRMMWVGNVTWMTMAVATPLIGLCQRRMPRRLFFFVGFCLFATAVSGTHWALRTSFVLLILVKGFVQGIALAMLIPATLGLALQWFPRHRGLVGGITMAGFGVGAFIWNQIITMWINPDNLQPDLADGENLYFTQAEMLHRLPSCYLMLGGVTGGIHLLILFSLTFPPTDTSATLETDTTQTTKEKNSESSDDKDCTIREVLTSRLIWILWFYNLTVDFAFIFIYSFYKTYGQTFIHDDHLLSLVASFSYLANAFCRPLWGLLALRIGFFPTLLLTGCILVLTSATFIASGFLESTTLYVMWVLIMVGTFSGYFTIQAPLVSSLFGFRHFVFFYGVVNSTGLISTVASVPLARVLLKAYGWAGVFMVASAFKTLGVVIMLTYLTFCRRHHHPKSDESSPMLHH